MSFASDSTEQATAQIHRLSVEPIPARKPKASPQAATEPLTPEIAPQEREPVPAPPVAPQSPVKSEHDALIAAFRTAAKILSVRGLLFAALIGALVLTVLAILIGGVMPLIALGLYLALTIVPIVYLEIRSR